MPFYGNFRQGVTQQIFVGLEEVLKASLEDAFSTSSV